MSYNPEGGKKSFQYLVAAGWKVSALCQADQNTTDKQLSDKRGIAVTRTPDFFTKQWPEMIKQDFLHSVVRVQAALLELTHQRGLSAAVNPSLRNTTPKFGGARKTPHTRDLHSSHFHPPNSFSLETLVSLPALCISCSTPLTLKHAHASFPNLDRI